MVDYREKKIIDDLSTIFPDIQITRLPVGDVIIFKRSNPFWNRFFEIGTEDSVIVIERKTISDFISSIRSGRIWDQMYRLCDEENVTGIRVKHRILVVHGSFEDYFRQIPDFQLNDEINVDGFWRFVTNTMTDIIFKYGIPIIMLNNTKQFQEFIKYIASTNLDHINPNIYGRRHFRRKNVKSSTEMNIQVDLLCSIPLISYRLAKRLMDEFKTISTICEASEKELRKVKGIGKKKAEIIFRVLHNDYKIRSTNIESRNKHEYRIPKQK